MRMTGVIRYIKRLAPAVLVALLVLVCAGCRSSDALVAIVYNQNAEDVTEDTSIIHNSEENTIQDDSIYAVAEVENSSNSRGWNNDVAQYGEGGDNTAEAMDASYYENAGSLYSTVETISREEFEALQDALEAEKLPEDEGIDTQEDEIPEESESAQEDMVSEDGDDSDVATVSGPVSAVGEAAILVQMLGGEGTLIATSEDFLENDMCQVVFSDEGASDVHALWSGSGEDPLDDEAFETLLSLEPAACFAISGENTFTEEQIAVLREKGIEYVVLPSMASATGIQTAVSVVGQVLGDRTETGGLDSISLAEEYNQWHKELLSDLASRTDRFTSNGVDFDNILGEDVKYADSYGASGYYTLYLSAWDSSVVYSLSTVSYIVLEEQGLPVAVKGYVGSPVSYYMSMAGVLNKAAAVFTSTKIQSWYVHPIKSVSHIKSISDGSEEIKFNNTNGSQISYLTEGLGSAEYPAIVVADATIKTALQNSAIWSYETIYDQNGLEVVSTIEGPYEIYVNPVGVGSWAEGSVESPLEAVWIGWKISGIYTQEETEQAVFDFYARFYRYELTEEEITIILLENAGDGTEDDGTNESESTEEPENITIGESESEVTSDTTTP